MAYLFTLLKTLRSDEKGATAIEYGLIAALIAVFIIGGLTFLGEELDDIFRGIGSDLEGAGESTD